MSTATKTPVSPARSAAARANGAKSNGPKTAEGKEKSSRNALQHGLSASKWLSLPGEDSADYEAFFEEMFKDLAPIGAEQEFYAARMIECMWRLRRIPILEARMANPKPHQFDHRCHTGLNLKSGWTGVFAEISRYETSLERTLERNRKALKALQNEPKPAAKRDPENTERPPVAPDPDPHESEPEPVDNHKAEALQNEPKHADARTWNGRPAQDSGRTDGPPFDASRPPKTDSHPYAT